MKNKLLFLSLVCVFGTLLTSCKKEIDLREDVVGTYDFIETGSVPIYKGKTLVTTLSMDNLGLFVVEKLGNGIGIRITGDVDTMDGTLNLDKTFTFMPNQTTTYKDGVKTEITFVYKNAYYMNNKINWTTDVSVIYTTSSGSSGGNGVLTLEAFKKVTR